MGQDTRLAPIHLDAVADGSDTALLDGLLSVPLGVVTPERVPPELGARLAGVASTRNP